MKWIFIGLAGLFIFAAGVHSIPVIDVSVQAPLKSATKPLSPIPSSPDGCAQFELHSYRTSFPTRSWVRPLRVTFSVDSTNLYHRTRLLRSCYSPFLLQDMKLIPSYQVLRSHEFLPFTTMSAGDPSSPSLLVSSVSIVLALPR